MPFATKLWARRGALALVGATMAWLNFATAQQNPPAAPSKPAAPRGTTLEIDPVEPQIAPRSRIPARGAPNLAIPVLGVAPFQAVPLQHRAIPGRVQQRQPNIGPLGERVADPFGLTRMALALEPDQIPQPGADDEIAAWIKEILAELDQLEARPDPKAGGIIINGQPFALGQFGNGQVIPFNMQQFGNGEWNVQPFAFGQPGRIRGAYEPRLGVMAGRVSPELGDQLDLPKGKGVVLTEVQAGSAAEKGGLKQHDIVLEFADEPVGDDPAAFARDISALKEDAKVSAVVIRKGKKETIKEIAVPEAAAGNGLGGGRNFGRGGVPPRWPLNMIPGVQIQPRAMNWQFQPFPAFPGAVPGVQSMQVQISNDQFTITATEGNLQYTVEGKNVAGKVEPTRIAIRDTATDKVLADAASIEKLPAEYQERAKQLLGNVSFGK